MSFFQNFIFKNSKFILLILAIIHGLLYITLIPPWQHYDEPGHFEYAWMIANHDGFPQKGDYDNEIRLKILESMKRNEFFNSPSLQELSTIAHTYDPVWIGITQVGDPPLYYLLVAAPLRLLKNFSVEAQLYAARIVSLFLFLMVILYAEKFAKKIDPKKKLFYYLFPFSLIFLPSFVEHSVAVNNDVAATLVYSMVIYYGFCLIKDGVNLKLTLILIALMGISYFTKGSIWIVVFIIPAGFYFAFFQKRKQPILGISLLLVSFCLGLLGLFRFDDAAYWLRNTTQEGSTRILSANKEYALNITKQVGEYNNAFFQFIDANHTDEINLSGKIVTVGLWIWADDLISIRPPYLLVLNGVDKKSIKKGKLDISTEPNFYTYHFDIPDQYDRLFLVLEPFYLESVSTTVYYQNIALVDGEYSGSELLKLNYGTLSSTSNGIITQNLIRNGNLNSTWPRIRPSIQRLFNKIDYRISEAANWIIFTLDTKATFWYTKNSAENLFRSFWAKFGWGHILLEGNKPYRILKIFSLISFLLFIWAIFKKKIIENLNILTWLTIVICGNLFYVWFTGISMRSYFDYPSYPDSRYLFPSVFILMGVISYGWSYLISKVTNRMKYLITAGYLIFLLSVNLRSIITVFNYYYV